MYCFFRGAVAARMFWIIIAFGQCVYSQYFVAALFFYHGNGILSINDNIHWYEIYAWFGCLFSKPFGIPDESIRKKSRKLNKLSRVACFEKFIQAKSFIYCTCRSNFSCIFFFFCWLHLKCTKTWQCFNSHTFFPSLFLSPTLPFSLQFSGLWNTRA